jgi:hypothetical protein
LQGDSSGGARPASASATCTSEGCGASFRYRFR